MNKNQELIADARKVERRVRSTLDTTVADLVRDLADAFEAREVAYTELLADYEAMKARVEVQPKWEYSVGFDDPEQGWINDSADIHDNYEDAQDMLIEPMWMVEDRVVRRRAAGPWLPVGGERDA